MNTVFLKTRELGEALLESEEYKGMKQAEDRAMKNAKAAFTMGQYLERKQQVSQLLTQEHTDTVELKRLSDEMEGFQQQLQAIDDITALTEARNQFSNLIEQVNKVLRFIVTGDMGQEEEGCSGSCSGCGGSCHGHGLN